MQKKLLAIAVAGALAPAAAMAQSTVEIYGRANLGVDNWRATGATNGTGNFNSRGRVFDSGSRLGFRVNESLGGGMRAFAVIETGVNIDTGTGNGQSGSTNASTGFWASRDSYLGLGGDWGDIRFGRQSPYYGNGIIAQADSNYINKAMDGAFSFNGLIVVPAGRTSNVLSYNSPTFGGFNASASWSPLATESGTYTGAGNQKKDNLWSVTARYTGGPFRLQADWVKRDNAGGNFTPGTTGTPELKGWKVGGGFAYAPGSQVSVIFGQHENTHIQTAIADGALTLAGAGTSPKVSIWVVNWEHMFGQFQLIAQAAKWNKLKNTTVTDNTDAIGYTLAGKYFLSKRTGVYASFSQIKNKDNAFYDMNNGGYSSGLGGANASLTAANRGVDPRIMAIGIMHNF